MAFGSSNPTLSDQRYREAARSEQTLVDGRPVDSPEMPGTDRVGARPGNRMTVAGAVQKTWITLGILVATFALGWSWVSGSAMETALPIAIGAGVLATILSLVVSFKPHIAPIGGPVFAALEGLSLGVISWIFELQYPGIVLQAVLGTLAVFATMLALWRAGIVRLGSRAKRIVTTAFFGLFVFFSLSFLMSFAGIQMPLVWDSGPLGIGLSLLVIGLAALMLTIDFDMVVEGEQYGAPRYMEWYSAFALTVTLVWIYFEMLRLISKLRD